MLLIPCSFCLMFLQILPSLQPIIVYFPDSSEWLSRAVPKSHRKEFVSKLEEMFDQLLGPVVLICGQNKVEKGAPKEKEKFVSTFSFILFPWITFVFTLPQTLWLILVFCSLCGIFYVVSLVFYFESC